MTVEICVLCGWCRDSQINMIECRRHFLVAIHALLAAMPLKRTGTFTSESNVRENVCSIDWRHLCVRTNQNARIIRLIIHQIFSLGAIGLSASRDRIFSAKLENIRVILSNFQNRA